MANTDMIREHNLAFSRGEHTYSLKMNKFGDLTTEEFTSQMNGYRSMRALGVPRSGAAYMVHSSAPLPSSKDWRQEGAVSPVKDQGQCGSCWAFSATGALESAWYLSKNEMVSLSEQDIMDCSKAYGNMVRITDMFSFFCVTTDRSLTQVLFWKCFSLQLIRSFSMSKASLSTCQLTC